MYNIDFSTLDSGLRDETGEIWIAPLVDDPISVPSTRVYAMKLLLRRTAFFRPIYFSTLDSGLRDETKETAQEAIARVHFSTLDSGLRDETTLVSLVLMLSADFSTLDSGLRDETDDRASETDA